ncbi:hypothetical protein V866_007946 [Kwoniella sp. B9012]
MTKEQISRIPNPVIPGFNPDPSLCRVGEDYFLATSTFEYFPGVPIYHSRDLVNWNLIGHALNRPSQLFMRRVDPGGGIFAPTLRWHKGKFYMATCCIYTRQGSPVSWFIDCCVISVLALSANKCQCAESRGFYVWTNNIFDQSTWSEPIYFDNLGIDQDLFFDDDDKVYLSTSRWLPLRGSPSEVGSVIFASEIDLATGSSLSQPVMLRRSLHSSRCSEGSHIFKMHGWYYLLVAEGGTHIDHQAWIFRSKSPLGLYEEPPSGVNPILFNGHHESVQNVGHADFVQDTRGDWWAFFLGVRIQENECGPLGRETFFCPVSWNSEGWPVCNGGKDIGLEVKTSLLPPQKPYTGWTDEFDQDKLDMSWYHLRTPVKQIYSLSNSPGALTLWGNAFCIQDVEAAAMLLQKQVSLRGLWSTSLDFEPRSSNEEAGTTIFWSCYAYAALVVRQGEQPGTREIQMRWICEESEDVKTLTKSLPLPSSGPVTLFIEARPNSYSLAFQAQGSLDSTKLGQVSTAVLERRRLFDSPYTGPHFGLFAQGSEGFPCLEPAVFHRASFEV